MSASGVNVFVSSIRSLPAPSRRTTALRSRIVGRASLANGRSSSRNGCSFFATGFDASTSGSTSSSAARRFTNVEFDRRMKPGSCSIALASASFSSPIARVVSFRLPISAARWSRRSASAVTSCELSTMKRSSAGVSWLSSRNRRAVRDSDGLRYW